MTRALSAHNAAAAAEAVTRPRWLLRVGALRLCSRGALRHGGHDWAAATIRQPAIDGDRATARVRVEGAASLGLEALLRGDAAPEAELLMLFGGAAPAGAADVAFEGVVAGAEVARGWATLRLAPAEDRFSPPLRCEPPAFNHLPADDLLLLAHNGAQAAAAAPPAAAPPEPAPRAPGRLPDWASPVAPAAALNAQAPRAPGNLLAKGRPIPIVYGEAQCNPLIFAAAWSAGTWTVGCAWCLGPVESVAVLLDGAAPAAGASQTHHLGAAAQAADPTLAAAIEGYADALVLDHPGGRIGVAYSVLAWADADYPSFPAITGTVRGMKTNAGAWSANPAHAARHFAEHPAGLGGAASAADFAALAAACDERVGEGDAAEPRRTIGLVMDRALPARQWLQILAAYCGGWIHRDGGMWRAAPDRPPAGARVSAFASPADSPDILWSGAADAQPAWQNADGNLRYVAGDGMPALPARLVAGGAATVRVGRVIARNPALGVPLFQVGLTAGPLWDSAAEALAGEDRLAICVRVAAGGRKLAASLPLAGRDDPYAATEWTPASRALAELLWSLPKAALSLGSARLEASVARAAALDDGLTVPGTAAALDGGDWVEGSFASRFADRRAAPTAVEVEHVDAAGAVWASAVASAELPGVATGAVPRRASRVRLPGVTRHSQAKREAAERLAKLRRAAVQHRFRGHADLDRLAVGDPVSIRRRGVLSTCRVLSRRRLESGHVEIAAAEYSAEDYDDTVAARPAAAAPPARLGGGARTYFELTAYRLAAAGAAAPAAPVGGSFRFSSGAFTPPPGWSAAFPAGRAPNQVAYASAATADALGGDLWTAAAGDWSAPFPAAREGDVNIVYQRSAGAPATPAPSAAVPAGWVDGVAAVPAGAGAVWASVGQRPADGADYAWQAPVRLEGEDGRPGAPGVAVRFAAGRRVRAAAPAAAGDYALLTESGLRIGMIEGWDYDGIVTHVELGGADAGERARYFPTVRAGDSLVGLDAAEDPDEWVAWRITSAAVSGATFKMGVEHVSTDAGSGGAFWAASDAIEFGFSRPPAPPAAPTLWLAGRDYAAGDAVLHGAPLAAHAAVSAHAATAANAPGTAGGAALWRAWGAAAESTDRDSIHRLAAARPATPAGGADAEEHLPAGWSRSRQAPTAGQSEWRSQRTRTRRGGAFASATPWEAPTRLRSPTGAATQGYDDAYRLAAAKPPAPTGGEDAEEHAPAGWARAAPAPAAGQDVWRSTRVRRFRGGAFHAAGAWGAPALLRKRSAAARRFQLSYDDVRPTSDGASGVDARGEYAILDWSQHDQVRDGPTFDDIRLRADGIALHRRDAGGTDRLAALRTLGPGDLLELRKGARWARWRVHSAFDSTAGSRRVVYFDGHALASSGPSAAAWGDGAATVTGTATTRQVVEAALAGGLKAGGHLFWGASHGLPSTLPAWGAANAAAQVSLLMVRSDGAMQLNTAASPAAARQLTDAWERGAAIRLRSGAGAGSTLRVAGPAAPGTAAADATEPYLWTPANSAQAAAFCARAAASGVAAQLSIEA